MKKVAYILFLLVVPSLILPMKKESKCSSFSCFSKKKSLKKETEGITISKANSSLSSFGHRPPPAPSHSSAVSIEPIH